MNKLAINIYRKPKWEWEDLVGFSGPRDGNYASTYGWHKTGYGSVSSGSNRSLGGRIIRGSDTLEVGTAWTEESINGTYLQFNNLTQAGDKVQVKYDTDKIIRFWYRYAGINQILFPINQALGLKEISLRRNNITFGDFNLSNLSQLEVFEISRNVSITSLTLHPDAPINFFYLDDTSVPQSVMDYIIIHAHNSNVQSGQILNRNIMPSQAVCPEIGVLLSRGWSITTIPDCTPAELPWRPVEPYCLNPPQIGVLSITETTDSTVSLSWTAATDDFGIEEYRLLYINYDYPDVVQSRTVGGGVLNITIYEMETGGYAFIVKAKNYDNLWSEDSNTESTSLIPWIPPSEPEVDEFAFDADYMVVTYYFDTGMDLDTRTGILGINQTQYLGWDQDDKHPNTNPIITWGGDNEGLGVESCLIDLIQYKNLYPTKSNITVDLRAFWFETLGTNVRIDAKLYKGGTMTKEGEGGNPAYGFTNTGYTDTLDVTSTQKKISKYTKDGTTIGERVAVLSYDLETGSGNFNINDTSTPTL